jgi:3-methylcrotonyl-CoA carboxylase alpha subunit
MFRRLLIANRGEIAVRVARTASRLGIETVAVYSDADRRAMHVTVCDRAVHLGGSEASASYLNVPRLLAAAREAGADALHPGYGFLSENAGFARAVLGDGIAWVGPHPDAIERMGSKIAARRIAGDAGVAVVPGFDASQDDAALADAAKRIGFPVLIKASAGGGGKGIRIVREAGAFAEQLGLARRESERAFGDAAVIVERYVERPRHVEVQVMGDRRGGLLHLLERECSIQRRHQKVIEEAPAPNLSDEQRAGLREAALRLTRAIGYDNAGTVEFVVDAESGEFFFLEMNTRLQVEHPVTEMVTGVDLVELQLRAAAGEPLPIRQEDVVARGWAIEARVAAEDPAADFAPRTGLVSWIAEPAGVRVDTGIRPGSEVSPYYDSMLAKVIAAGRDRESARKRLAAALRSMLVVGLPTNLDFLARIVEHPVFASGRLTTRFLEEHGAELAVPPAPHEGAWVAALAEVLDRHPSESHTNPWQRLGSLRVTPHRPSQPVTLAAQDGSLHAVRVQGVAPRFEVMLDAERREVQAWWEGDHLLVEHGGTLERHHAHRSGDRWTVRRRGRTETWRVVPREELWRRRESAASASARALEAPFPALVSEVRAEPGQVVAAGDVLVVLEAMKMLHNLVAEGVGIVDQVRVQPGMTVETGAVLVTFAEGE